MRKVLVAGGAGYIGSHTVVELIENGYEVVVVDDLSNSSSVSIERVEKITGSKIRFYKANCNDSDAMREIFSNEQPSDVIMFAGFKAVGESVAEPLKYFTNNLGSALTVLNVMKEYGCRNILFSSSATVYGDPAVIPITEDCPKGVPTNPYGRTKSMIEDILFDIYAAEPDMNIGILRYFNPIGAHESGLIGEDPQGIPNNLVPYIAQVAVGKREVLHVYGNDYPTIDGTGVRDYIHVVDLAKGHVAALDKMASDTGCFVVNLGTGHGYSVLEVVHAYEEACGHKINYQIDPRRPGDIATCYCDPGKAYTYLGWKAEKNILDMCRDSYNWQKQNPDGYRS